MNGSSSTTSTPRLIWISAPIRTNVSSAIELNASTTRGSNWLPDSATIISRAARSAATRGGRGGRWSARRARRRPRTRAPRAGSPRRPVRRDSQCRPSARGASARPRRLRARNSIPPTISAPISGWWAISARSSLGQRAGLVEDRVGDRDLADVVQQEPELDLGRVRRAAGPARGRSPSHRRRPARRACPCRRRGPRPRWTAPARWPCMSAELLRAGALLLEGLAQVGGIALELALLVGRFALPPCELRAQALDLRSESFAVHRQLSLAPERHRLRPAWSRRRSPRSAASSAGGLLDGHDLHPELADTRGGRGGSVGEQDHGASQPAAAQVERLQHGLRVADPDVDQRDLEAPLAAHAGGGRAGRLPLVLDAELVERGLEHGLQLLRARRRAPASVRRARRRPARRAARRRRSAWRPPTRPASSLRPENTDTNTIGVARSSGSARIWRSTSKPSIPGIRMSSVTASKRSARSSASASSPLGATVAWTSSGASWPAISSAISRSSSTISTRRPRITSSDWPASARTAAGMQHAERRARARLDSRPRSRPWCRSTSDLTIDSPRPVPGRRARRCGRGRSDRTCGRAPPRVIPMPESATTIWTQARSASTPIWIRPPSWVYRWALVSRLATIWRTRPGSASASGSVGRRHRRRAAGAWRRSAGPSARRPRGPPRRRRSAGG